MGFPFAVQHIMASGTWPLRLDMFVLYTCPVVNSTSMMTSGSGVNTLIGSKWISTKPRVTSAFVAVSGCQELQEKLEKDHQEKQVATSDPVFPMNINEYPTT